MNPVLRKAKEDLEVAGLEVKASGEDALWIAAASRDAGGGVRLSHDACMLIRQGDRWVAVFPAEGHSTYEVPGELPRLLPLIHAVYGQYRRRGGPFEEAFRQSVPDAEAYLAGGAPTEGRGPAVPPPAPAPGEWGAVPKKG